MGLSPCKINCLAKKAIPLVVSKNLPILNLSFILLLIKPVMPGAPLTKPPTSSDTAPWPIMPESTPQLFPTSLKIKGCLNCSKPAFGSDTALYDFVETFPFSSIPAGTFLNVFVIPYAK